MRYPVMIMKFKVIEGCNRFIRGVHSKKQTPQTIMFFGYAISVAIARKCCSLLREE